jgi:hypothetical protein
VQCNSKQHFLSGRLIQITPSLIATRPVRAAKGRSERRNEGSPAEQFASNSKNRAQLQVTAGLMGSDRLLTRFQVFRQLRKSKNTHTYKVAGKAERSGDG